MKPAIAPVTFDPARLRIDRGRGGMILDGKRLRSVGRIVSAFAPFDRFGIAYMTAVPRAATGEGDLADCQALADEMRAVWADWDERRDAGTRAHDFLESLAIGNPAFPDDAMQRGLLAWWRDQRRLEVVAFEQCVVDPDERYGGFLDLVIRRGIVAETIIIDCKTGSWSNTGRNRLTPPLQHLTDGKLVTTGLQAGLYRRALTRHYAFASDYAMALHVAPDGRVRERVLPDFDAELLHLLKQESLGTNALWIPPAMPKAERAPRCPALPVLPLFRTPRKRKVTT